MCLPGLGSPWGGRATTAKQANWANSRARPVHDTFTSRPEKRGETKIPRLHCGAGIPLTQLNLEQLEGMTCVWPCLSGPSGAVHYWKQKQKKIWRRTKSIIDCVWFFLFLRHINQKHYCLWRFTTPPYSLSPVCRLSSFSGCRHPSV